MEAEELGVCGYLIKPLEIEQLLETVARCVMKRGGGVRNPDAQQ
jgi:response regulator of citrate/malate metabolism